MPSYETKRLSIFDQQKLKKNAEKFTRLLSKQGKIDVVQDEYFKGKTLAVDIDDGQQIILGQNFVHDYSPEAITSLVKKMKDVITLLKNEVPNIHDLFVDDIKKIEIVSPSTNPNAQFLFAEGGGSMAFKSEEDPDLMYINADFLDLLDPKDLVGVLVHEDFHAEVQTFLGGYNTKEEEALAYKSESKVMSKILKEEPVSNDEIRKHVLGSPVYEDLPSILLKDPVWKRLLSQLGND